MQAGTFTIDAGIGMDAVSPAVAIPPRKAGKFGYDCTEDKGRRKAPYALLRSEDDELPRVRREQAITLGRDIRRNFSIAAWAIRRHLDYVARFRFRAITKDKALDRRITELITWCARAENCDAARRHSLPQFLRLAEASRTVDGDVLMLLLGNGRLQAIEADRIRTPQAYAQGERPLSPAVLQRMRWGVVLDDYGGADAFAVNRRGATYPIGPDWQASPNSFIFERLVPARNCHHLGYFDRFDQVRGISPVLAALNSFRDAYEGFDYALAQAKVAQLFALVIKRSSLKAVEEFERSDGPTDYKQQLDFNRGPALLDLDPEDAAEFLQSNNPSANWQAFMNMVIAVALKSLDIPFCFYDEAHTNYSATRGSWLMYDQSAEEKADPLRTFLDRWTAWRLGMLIYQGVLELPRDRSVLRDLRWGWIRKRIPWIDPLKEIQAAKLEVDAGYNSTPGIAESMGMDAYEIAEQQADYLEFREELGLPPLNALPPVPIIAEPEEGNGKKKASEEDQ